MAYTNNCIIIESMMWQTKRNMRHNFQSPGSRKVLRFQQVLTTKLFAMEEEFY